MPLLIIDGVCVQWYIILEINSHENKYLRNISNNTVPNPIAFSSTVGDQTIRFLGATPH